MSADVAITIAILIAFICAPGAAYVLWRAYRYGVAQRDGK